MHQEEPRSPGTFGLNNSDHNQHLLSTCRVPGSPHNHPER